MQFGYADRAESPRREALKEVIQIYFTETSVSAFKDDLDSILREEQQNAIQRHQDLEDLLQ